MIKRITDTLDHWMYGIDPNGQTPFHNTLRFVAMVLWGDVKR